MIRLHSVAARIGALLLLTAGPRTIAAQRAVDVRHAASPTVSLRILGSFAELRIRGWDKDSVALTGTVPTDARFDGGFLNGPGGASPGGKFYLESSSGTPSGKLELRVPVGARVWSKSGSATIDVDGVNGGLDLNIIGGSVRVAGRPHDLTVESMDGSVTIDGSPAWARLKTATGDIIVNGGSDDAGLTTVSGTIHVLKGRYERARIETVTGAVEFAGEVARGGSLDIDTHSGPIELRFPAKAAAEFDVASVAGTIENSLTSRSPVSGREGRGQEIGFSIGQGGGRIYIRTFKGNIRLLPASGSKISLKMF